MGVLDTVSPKRREYKELVKTIVEASCCVACADKANEGDAGITYDEVRAMLTELKEGGAKCREPAMLNYFEECRSRIRASGLKTVLGEVDKRLPELKRSGMIPLFLSTIDQVAVADGQIHSNELRLILHFRTELELVPKAVADPKKNGPDSTVILRDPKVIPAIHAMVAYLPPLARSVCFDLTCGLLAAPKAGALRDELDKAWTRAMEQHTAARGPFDPMEHPRFPWFRRLTAAVFPRSWCETATASVDDAHQLHARYNSNVTACALVVYAMAKTIPNPAETGRFLKAVGFPSPGAP